jgi:hypothetical protein
MVPSNTLLHKTDGTYIVVYENKKFSFKKVDLLMENTEEAIIKQCTTLPIAKASEAKLALLPSYGEIYIDGEK